MTEYFRVSNLDLFNKEVKKRVVDLNYTKEKFIEAQKRLGKTPEDDISITV